MPHGDPARFRDLKDRASTDCASVTAPDHERLSANYRRCLRRLQGRDEADECRMLASPMSMSREKFMWPRNTLTDRLNLKWPILQAPMGWLSTPALAAAVSNAGGLGGLGMWGFSAEDAERRIAGFRQQSSGSLNVNYPLWPEPKITPQVSEAMRRRLQRHYDVKGLGAVPQPKGAAREVSRENLAMLLRAKPQMVSFHFGLPRREIMQALKGAEIFTISSATTVAEARHWRSAAWTRSSRKAPKPAA